MPEQLFSTGTALGTIEFMSSRMPRLPELVDLWSDYLEFWAQTGGMDEANCEEIEQAHDTVQARTEEVFLEYNSSVVPSASITQAYSNMALAAAKDLRQQVLDAQPGEINDYQTHN